MCDKEVVTVMRKMHSVKKKKKKKVINVSDFG